MCGGVRGKKRHAADRLTGEPPNEYSSASTQAGTVRLCCRLACASCLAVLFEAIR